MFEGLRRALLSALLLKYVVFSFADALATLFGPGNATHQFFLSGCEIYSKNKKQIRSTN